MKKSIAIIGAGISGITIAKDLSYFADVTIFEKSRGIGGRMSTRYSGDFSFDHGAQFFTAKTKMFQDFLAPYLKSQQVSSWNGNVISFASDCQVNKVISKGNMLVANPTMNSLCKNIAQDLQVMTNIEVAPLLSKNSDGLWLLEDVNKNKIGEFDFVISTAPAAQTIRLFANFLPNDSVLSQVKMSSCFSLMLGFNSTWDRDWIAAEVENPAIKWISINSTKPFRNNSVSSIVVHSRNDWANLDINVDKDNLQHELLKEFERIVNVNKLRYDYVSSHLWRYAITEKNTNVHYINYLNKLAATGDWVSTSNIESVWLDAKSLSTSIINNL